MLAKIARVATNKWFFLGAGLLLGAAIILGIRLVTYKPGDVHYHANFALYINGQQEQFKSPAYYEEGGMCTLKHTMTTAERAHMHDNINNVVHVEDHAVTWGQFFANLGWYMGPNFIQSPEDVMYAEDGNAKLHIIINGQDYTDLGGVANTIIKDHDRLLVSYGDESDATVQQEYKAVPATAQHYDVTKDPKSCSGHDDTDMSERMKHIF